MISEYLSALVSSGTAYMEWLAESGQSLVFGQPAREPTAEERLLAAGLRAAQDTVSYGRDFISHIGLQDREMVERAVLAAWEVWEKGLVDEAV